MFRPARSLMQTIDGATGKVSQTDTFTCLHCQAIVAVPPKADPNAVSWCAQCHGPVCQACAKAGGCDPFEKKLERIEHRDRVLRSYGVTG